MSEATEDPLERKNDDKPKNTVVESPVAMGSAHLGSLKKATASEEDVAKNVSSAEQLEAFKRFQEGTRHLQRGGEARRRKWSKRASKWSALAGSSRDVRRLEEVARTTPPDSSSTAATSTGSTTDSASTSSEDSLVATAEHSGLSVTCFLYLFIFSLFFIMQFAEKMICPKKLPLKLKPANKTASTVGSSSHS